MPWRTHPYGPKHWPSREVEGARWYQRTKLRVTVTGYPHSASAREEAAARVAIATALFDFYRPAGTP